MNMDKEQFGAALDGIAIDLADAASANERATAKLARIKQSLEVPPVAEPESEPVEPPVVEPGPTNSIYIKRYSIDGGFAVTLPAAQRASGRVAVHIAQPIASIEHFRTEAGGVTETICVLHNGNPEGRGAIHIPELEIKTHDGRVIFRWDETFDIEPGYPLVVSDYYGGTMLDFATAIAADAPTPGPQFDEMLHKEWERQMERTPDVGPYVMGWPADPSGGGQGGDGIEPRWHLWRNCPGGRALAWLEVQRTMQREGRIMTDWNGAFAWDPHTAYNADGYFMPDAFKSASPSHKYRPHGAQHWHRAYRAATWIDQITNGTHAFTRWYLEMLANWEAACSLATAADREDINSSGWWSLTRTVEWARGEGPNPKCGRAAVHRARFAFECAKRGIGGREMARVADLWEEMFLVSADATGRSFETQVRKVSDVAKDFPSWDGSERIAQSRELQLAVAMMRDSERPRLIALADTLADTLGPFPATVINYTRGISAGGTNVYYELMTHGDLSAVGGSRESLLRLAESRSVEAGGSQPLNSCRSADLWLEPDANPRRGIVS